MKYLLPFTGSIALRWTHPDSKYWVEGRIFGADTEDRTSDADQAADKERIPTNGTPGYVVASLYAGWKVNEHLDLSCGAENPTDEDYRIHGSGQNEPGLTGVFRAKVSW
jgi:hemoglobin/transferrin/lactoferrin receptor protein